MIDKLIGGCIGILAGLLAGWYFGYGWNEAKHVEHERDSLLAYAERIKQGVEQDDKNKARIAVLTADLNRVRIHIPSCPAKDSNGTSGMASARIDEYLAEAKRSIDSIGERCARLNADAIRANTLMIDKDTGSVPDHKP